MKNYSLNSWDDVISTDQIWVTHRLYGGNIWERSHAERLTTCAVTGIVIRAGEKCYVPCAVTPYSNECISMEGYKRLTNHLRYHSGNKKLSRAEELSS